ncbi:MAG: hypothetical protein EOO62_34345, partial [Hymenobacter sp.]
LNVLGNARTYHLPVRVVYLVKDGPGAATSLAKLQANFTKLGVAYHFNHFAFNQAQIQVEFEKTNQVHQLTFKQAEWAGKYYDVAHNWFTDYLELDPKTGSVRQKTIFLDKIMADYVAKYETKGGTPFRGILLIMTDIKKNPADNQGGVSRVRPVDFRGALIFESSLQERETYTHEIGHALGLDHIFLDATTNTEAADNATFIKNSKTYQASLQNLKKSYADSVKFYQSALAENRAKLLGHPPPTAAEKLRLERDIQRYKKSLSAEQQYAADNDKRIADAEKDLQEAQQALPTFAANLVKFTQNSTDNYMDYFNIPNQFYHWQWKIMQRDLVTYYGYAK